jgi:small-conductance mechanosensitive channel
MHTFAADVMQTEFLHNTVRAWLTGALTAAVVLLVGLIARRLLVARLGKVASRTTNQIDDMIVGMIARTKTWFVVALALLAGLAPLTLPPRLAMLFGPTTKLVFLSQIGLWCAAGIEFWVKHQLEHRTGTHDRTSIAMISAMGVGATVLIWILILLTALRSVFGVEITPLITGLGVSGIAVALAVQNILGDLLAALAIVFDKPFDVGDPIGVDQISGTVERIGLKTTHIRSTTGEQIIIGNGDLLKSRLRNYRRMRQRRIVLLLDVTYDTPPEMLERIPKMVEAIITAQQQVKFDRSHVASFGESAIRIETVYIVLDPDYNLYMNVQQAINLEVIRQFNAEQVKFAFPSRTLYHEGLTPTEISVAPQPSEAPES